MIISYQNTEAEQSLMRKFAEFVEQYAANGDYQFYIPNLSEQTKKTEPVVKIFTKSAYDNKGMFPFVAYLADFPYYNHFDSEGWMGHVVGNFEDTEENLEKLKAAYINLTNVDPDVSLLTTNNKIWEIGKCVLFNNTRWINMETAFKHYLKTITEDPDVLRKHLFFRDGELYPDVKELIEADKS
uniref:Alpha amylase catalytic region n=1 Tax=Glaesserella parasuis TaxID=738 RepID=F1CNF4_GLAPU|nr:alpha amylase catalytic region [Glaesserella parasuis]